MDLDLRGKGVIVTGASRGIGRSIAHAFADEGASLAVCARGQEGVDKIAGELRAKGAKVHAAACDVSDGKQLDAFLDGAEKALGRIDVLVNNPSALAMNDDEAAWKASFDVDLMAAVRALWKVVPWME
ncbi:MAG: SDR family NAD(P)-dependent oxidoreductase, partial [Candidatus Binatia bacterium]